VGETRGVIRRFAIRRVLGVAALLVLLAADGGVRAQSTKVDITSGGSSTAQLAQQGQALANGDAEVRKAAYLALSSISLQALPAALAHFQQLARIRPTHEEALRILTAFRHAAGSKRADDDLDIARGVLPALGHERSPAALVMAQNLAFMRALEALGDPDAYMEIARFVGLDEGAWDSELRLLRKRKGKALLPALIRLRSHESADVRRFAQASVTALGMDDPTLVLTDKNPYALASFVRAYSNPPDYAAMPLIVRLVNDPHIQVEQAARAAVARFGKNAIWQVRELYEEVSGQAADKSWSPERSASELYTVFDRAQLEDAETLMARGMKSFVAGDFVAMQRDYDTLLAKHPDFDAKQKLAPGYAAVGGEHLEADDLTGAVDAYRRALRLQPDAADGKHWRAQLAFAAAELSLTRGIVDLPGYDRALSFEPDHARAKEARDRLSGDKNRRAKETKRFAAVAALAILLVLAVLVGRPRAREAGAPAEAESAA
jgi:tetratricopeptide (TPR) repeat protein